jgi:hypothetical protein
MSLRRQQQQVVMENDEDSGGDEGAVMAFASNRGQRAAALAAAEHIKVWEKTLSYRITLQKLVDNANKLACATEDVRQYADNEAVSALRETNSQLVAQVKELLELQQTPSSESRRSTKRKLDDFGDDLDGAWQSICSVQNSLQPRWEETINKWHSRLNFGTFDATSKMKTFKQTLWQQV